MESKYEECFRTERLMDICLRYDIDLKINYSTDIVTPFQPDFSAHNKAIEELLKIRKEVAKRYFEDKLSPEAKYESIQIFLKCNEDIRRIVGL